jgi:putative NIF3 family GTP cyclohydrolase 1 type 2
MKEKCVKLMTKNDIIHAFFHLPLDDASFGTSSSLANALCLKNCQKAIPEDIYLCSVVGETEAPIQFEQFCTQLTNVLKESIRAFQNNNNPISKVCITSGGGHSTTDIRAAVEQGCDTYITGEYVLYSQLYAKLSGINLLIGSHTNTEVLGVEHMAKRLIENTDIVAMRLPEINY